MLVKLFTATEIHNKQTPSLLIEDSLRYHKIHNWKPDKEKLGMIHEMIMSGKVAISRYDMIVMGRVRYCHNSCHQPV